MRQGFVTLASGRDESRIAASNGVVGSFSEPGQESATPQDRLGVLQIALDEQLLFARRSREVDDDHLAAKTEEDVVTGVDDTAGGVKDQFALAIGFEVGENLVQSGDFFGEVLGFALRIGGAVRPTHPSGDTIDAGVSAGLENGSEARLDLVVAADGGASARCEVLRPMAFSGTGHADEGEAQRRLLRIGGHKEPKSVIDFREPKNAKENGRGRPEAHSYLSVSLKNGINGSRKSAEMSRFTGTGMEALRTA
jgi:hypothetical protein